MPHVAQGTASRFDTSRFNTGRFNTGRFDMCRFDTLRLAVSDEQPTAQLLQTNFLAIYLR